MNIIAQIKHEIIQVIQHLFTLDKNLLDSIDLKLNVDAEQTFGDISCNVAMVIAKHVQKSPRDIAQHIKDALSSSEQGLLKHYLKSIEIAGPGFLNISFNQQLWTAVIQELLEQREQYYGLNDTDKKYRFLIEFVSANPTGPLHLGAGRNGVIGDVLSKVLQFLGHKVHKEYIINDAGNQIKLLGQSLQARCKQELGVEANVPDGGYVGDYLFDIARDCIAQHGRDLLEKKVKFFTDYAKNALLKNIKKDLEDYGIVFDEWYSETSLHERGEVDKALNLLQEKGLAYEKDGALWFKATEFDDEKDRVLKKQTGEATYIAGDVAYHKNKFDRGFDILIDIFGQDHHGYVKRLKATMDALGYPAERLMVILYQLVTIKKSDEIVKMSKRSGSFTKLRDVIDVVGKDVARFFYLNRKAEAHLELDLDVALKKSQENPVFYIQYAYVRILSLLDKASQESRFATFVDRLKNDDVSNLQNVMKHMIDFVGEHEIRIIKKIASLQDILMTIARSYQTHLLAYYSWELAHLFHNYYTNNRIINVERIGVTESRLLLVYVVKNTLEICLQLLGLDCPKKM